MGFMMIGYENEYEYIVQKTEDGGVTWKKVGKVFHNYDDAQGWYLNCVTEFRRKHNGGVLIRTGLTDEAVLKRYHAFKLTQYRVVKREIHDWEPV